MFGKEARGMSAGHTFAVMEYAGATERWARRLVAGVAGVLLATIFAVPPAEAAFVTLTPSSGTIQVGGSFDLDVVVSELPDGEIVSAFDLDLLFDPGLLSFSGLSFGPGFGSADDIVADALDLAGVIDFFLFSFLLDDELFALQEGGSVRLATLTFTAVAAGIASLAIDGLDDFLLIGGRDGSPLSITEFGTARVVVEAASATVPEPGSLALMAFGVGLGLFGRRRRLRASG
jgi:hypothetical protein